MAAGLTTDDPRHLNENDLLPHSEFIQKLHGNETVWIRDISGPATTDDPIVTIACKQLTLVGHRTHLLDRLRAAVRLLEEIDERRGDWDLLLSRLPRGTRRTWPHPFTDEPSADARHVS